MKALIRPFIIWLVLASIVPLSTLRGLRIALRVKNDSHFAEGTVVALEPKNHQRVVARYQVAGVTYTTDTFQSDRYGLPAFGALKLGDKVPVNYSPVHPEAGELGRADKAVAAFLQDDLFVAVGMIVFAVVIEARIRIYLKSVGGWKTVTAEFRE